MALSERLHVALIDQDLSPKNTLNAYVAVCAAAVALLPLPGISVLTGSVLICVFMLPVVAPVVRRTPGMILLALLTFLVFFCAPLANFIAGGTVETVPTWDWMSRPLSLLFSVAALAWASKHLGLRHAILLAIPAPMIFDWISRSSQGNDWKYSLSVWVTVGALIVIQNRSYVLKIMVLLALIAVSALNDTRGIIAMLVISIAVDLLSRGGKNRTHKTAMAFIGSVIAATTAFQLAISGAFGSSIRQTMLTQTEFGPLSILRSARPESGGNLALIFQDPWRFVISDSLTAEQASIIRDSFAQVSRDPDSRYVSQNILHGAELHSIAADLWLHIGFFGIIVGLTAAIFFILTMFRAVWVPTSLTLVGMFVALRAVWDLLFSPASDLRFWPLYVLIAFFMISERRTLSEHAR